MSSKQLTVLSVVFAFLALVIAVLLYNFNKKDNCFQDVPRSFSEIQTALMDLYIAQYVAIGESSYIPIMQGKYIVAKQIINKNHSQMSSYCGYAQVEEIKNQLKRNGDIVKRILEGEKVDRNQLKNDLDKFLEIQFTFHCCGAKK